MLSSVVNSIDDLGASAIAEALKMNTRLQNLNLESVRSMLVSVDNRIEAKGASVLSEALKVNTALQNLNLKGMHDWFVLHFLLIIGVHSMLFSVGNRIDDKGASALAEALKMNTTLQNLNVE
ncbi:hypothetical protein BC936DRAFT_149090, partial [Jimgerdemannia flammicorona]